MTFWLSMFFIWCIGVVLSALVWWLLRNQWGG